MVKPLSRRFWFDETGRMVIAALMPFGTFINDRFLARKHREASA